MPDKYEQARESLLDQLATLDPMEALEPFPVYASDFAPSWVSQYRRESHHAD